ncbi:MAG: ATP-binding cassette domain-containing protein [Candidatus Limnocylindrales bacterium]
MVDAITATGLIRIHPTPGGPVAALRGLDLHVASGEIAAVVGPSGSGKSSLLRILAGMDRPSAGRLVIFGQDLSMATETQLDRHRRDAVGLVEQHYRRALSPYLRAAAAIELPLALRGVAHSARRARARDLLTQLGLADRAEAWPHQLSGGEQQRIAFGVALASRPVLLLADEPTGELDGAAADELLGVIRELVRSEGTTCVIVTHDVAVEEIADRVVHVADGRAVAERVGWVGAAPVRSRDIQGWLAPELPQEPVQSGAAVRRAVARRAAGGGDESGDDPLPDAVVMEAVARRFGTVGAAVGSLGLPPVDARLARGGFHVITGPSGSGKTTLLRCLTGLDRPTEGRILTLGQDLALVDRDASARFRAAHVGLVDQARDLIPFLTAVENVQLGLALRGPDRRGAQDGHDGREQAITALARFGVRRLADRAPDGLSAGERLRVALARAIAGGPELLVLDEPTAALDRRAAGEVADLLGTLDSGVTIVASTHDRELIAAASNRLDLTTHRPAARSEEGRQPPPAPAPAPASQR